MPILLYKRQSYWQTQTLLLKCQSYYMNQLEYYCTKANRIARTTILLHKLQFHLQTPTSLYNHSCNTKVWTLLHKHLFYWQIKA